MLEILAAWCQPWADYFADSTTLSTAVIATHVVAMFVGGGMAIGADRAILRAAPGSAEAVRAVIADLATVHSVVVTALGVTIVSGAALLTADIATLATSTVYWIKMALIATLLINGYRMRAVERMVLAPFGNVSVHTTELPTVFPVRTWRIIRVAAVSSLLLWTGIVILGVMVSNG